MYELYSVIIGIAVLISNQNCWTVYDIVEMLFGYNADPIYHVWEA